MIGALIGAGASVFGNAMSALSNQQTNNTNYRIAQMNNEFNERMLQKQMDYNTDMWNKQNEYNTASAQRKRLEEAGLNPYLMMNGGSAGSASSAMGVNPPTAQGVTMQPNQFDFSGIGQAVQDYARRTQQQPLVEANSRNINAQAQEKEISNEYARRRYTLELLNQYEDARSKSIKNYLGKEIQRSTLDNMMQEYVNKQKQAREYDLRADGIKIENYMNALRASKLPLMLKYEIAQRAADVELTHNLSVTEGYKQASIWQDLIESTAREFNIHLDNQVKKEAVQDLIDMYHSDANWRDWNNATQGLSNVGNAVSGFSNLRKKSHTSYRNHGGNSTRIYNPNP